MAELELVGTAKQRARCPRDQALLEDRESVQLKDGSYWRDVLVCPKCDRVYREQVGELREA